MTARKALERIVDAGAPEGAVADLEQVLVHALGYTPDAAVWGGSRAVGDTAAVLELADTRHAAAVHAALEKWYRSERYHYALALLVASPAGAGWPGYKRDWRRARDLRRAYRARLSARIAAMRREINEINRSLRA